jgi:oligopeptidase B
MTRFSSIGKNLFWLKGFSFAAIAIFACQNPKKEDMIPPPIAKKINKELSIHGDTRIDPYYWLNDRENPEVIAYLEAENEYTAKMMAHTDNLQKQLFEEMKERIVPDDSSTPYLSNGYLYYSRYETNKDHPIYCRKTTEASATETIILDVNELAKDYDYYSAVGLNVSPDNKILAYGQDTVSRRLYTIQFKNLETGELLNDKIPNASGGVVWAADSKSVFYTQKDLTTLRTHQIKHHILGTDPASDRLVFEEKDETFSVYVTSSRSKKYIYIVSGATVSTEVQILDPAQPLKAPAIFQPRERDHEYNVTESDGKFYIVTNWQAKNFRLMSCDPSNTNKSAWKEVLPERSDVLLEDASGFAKHLVINERKEGIVQIRVKSATEDTYVKFPEASYVADLGPNAEYETDKIRLFYNSLTTPNTDMEYTISTKKLEVLKEKEVRGGFDKNNYESERIYANARDGAKVPLSIVYKKGTQKNGKSPLLLYAYGSYGYSMDPGFNMNMISLLDRGFIFAIAHIRGGQEMGRSWYEDGKLLKKKNTFTDFIDCGEFLIKENYTASDRLFAEGGSAGGLLMGAILNMRPDLFKGVVAEVAFVDVVTTMLDETIPLTTSEYDEWGNPNDKIYYDYMKSYSPYDNVTAQEYPAMLVTTGLHDSQVQYWEPAKWVAKLRATKTSDNPLYLHTDLSAGHGGAAGRYKRLNDVARVYAFMIDLAPKGE